MVSPLKSCKLKEFREHDQLMHVCDLHAGRSAYLYLDYACIASYAPGNHCISDDTSRVLSGGDTQSQIVLVLYAFHVAKVDQKYSCFFSIMQLLPHEGKNPIGFTLRQKKQRARFLELKHSVHRSQKLSQVKSVCAIDARTHRVPEVLSHVNVLVPEYVLEFW